MTADELTMVERSPLVESHPKLFHPQILLAYKFQALPLASRACCKYAKLRSFCFLFFLFLNLSPCVFNLKLSGFTFECKLFMNNS